MVNQALHKRSYIIIFKYLHHLTDGGYILELIKQFDIQVKMGEAEEQLMLEELQDSLEDIGYNKVLIIVYPSLICLYTLTMRFLRIYCSFSLS